MTESVLKYFNRLYEPAKRHMQGMSAQWDEYERAYLGEPEGDRPTDKENSWRSFIHFKYAWQQAHTLVAELATDDDPTFMWEPRQSANDAYAAVVQSVVGYQLERDDYAEKRFMSALTAAVYGGCPVKTIWQFEELPDGTIAKDQPTALPLDPRHFFYDPRARHMREARFAGHVMNLEYEELKARKRADGSPLYDLSEVERKGPRESTSEMTINQLDNDFSGERDKARRSGLEVVELWTRTRILTRCNGKIIRDDENPLGKIPFEVVTILPSLNDVWGLSLMWALRDPQDLIQSLDNAAMDGVKLMLDPPRAVDSSDPQNQKRAFMPGQVYPSSNPKDAIVPLRVNAVDPFTAQQSIQGVRDLTKHITGITDEMAGQSNADTATEAAINSRQAKGRAGIMLRFLDSSWARVAGLFLALDQKYLDMSVPVKLAGAKGAEWRHVAPKEIAGQWDVRAKNSSERVVKEQHRQNLMEALNTLAPLAERTTATGKTVDLTVFAEALAESFGFSKERIIVDAQMQRVERQKDVISDAEAQAQAQAMMPQQPPAPMPAPEAPEAAPSLIEQAQSKLFTSVNYKDLPDAAQKDMLEQIGLPSEGIEDDNQNPTRPNAGKNLDFEGRSAGQKARQATKGGKGA